MELHLSCSWNKMLVLVEVAEWIKLLVASSAISMSDHSAAKRFRSSVCIGQLTALDSKAMHLLNDQTVNTSQFATIWWQSQPWPWAHIPKGTVVNRFMRLHLIEQQHKLVSGFETVFMVLNSGYWRRHFASPILSFSSRSPPLPPHHNTPVKT